MEIQESSLQDYLNNINSNMAPKEINQTTKLTDLPQNTPFIIKGIKRINTKYGEMLLAELVFKYNETIVDYRVFLPQRFAKMSQPQIDILNKVDNIRMVYNGKNKSGVHDLIFKTVS